MKQINRLIALVHPSFNYHDYISDDPDERVEEHAYHEELWASWLEGAAQLNESEVMVLFTHALNTGEAKQHTRDEQYYIQKIYELKEVLQDRLIVLTEQHRPVWGDHETAANRTRYEMLNRIMNARGFTVDPNTATLEVWGMSMEICVQDTAEYMNEAGDFTLESIIRVARTDENHLNEEEIEAKNQTAKRELKRIRYK